MRVIYNPQLKAQLSVDDEDRVRAINHFQEYWRSARNTPLEAAIEYLHAVAGVLGIPSDRLSNAHQQVSYSEPEERASEYRQSTQRQFFDATTVAFEQTFLNVPVWGSGITVTIKHDPLRVVAAADTSREGVEARLPRRDVLETRRKLFAQAAMENEATRAGVRRPEKGWGTSGFVRTLVDRKRVRKEAPPPKEEDEGGDDARLIRGRFFVYRYNQARRLLTTSEDLPSFAKREPSGVAPNEPQESPTPAPVLPLSPVPKEVRDGRDYLVAEVTFSYATQRYGRINWLALVEVETNSVLYLRPLADYLNGLVFHYDPICATGNVANSSNQPSAVLNPLRSSRTLANLNAPSGGTQSLVGTYANITNQEDPIIVPPTQPAGNDFNYDARTNNFGAVNAYYHTDRLFQIIASLGFPIATYFNNTTFPIPVDHRGLGNVINAHCVGNGIGGIGHCCYALCDTTDTANPLARAVDWWVHCHEVGGHGVLYEFVNSANFGFCHSAGDTIAALQNDTETLAPDRFEYAPFNPVVTRRFDRDVAAGWAWGGIQDSGGYPSEEILTTTLFRAYRSMGGDSAYLPRREFASRMMTYLILRTVSTLTPATNPGNALAFANAMMAVDLLNWTSEGVFGGAYNKVIRWAFERQGLYQAPGAPTPVNQSGAPPNVDVYIDDGRGGEYPFQAVHWNNTSIWNRNAADGLLGYQPPILAQSNYVYVKIKNRGTQTAQNVKVKGFHCKPSAGLLWPDDLQAMTTTEISAGTLGANNSEEKTVGPFEWTPVINAYGHDCLLMIVSADSDPSNVDNFTPGETIPEWRLVPNDNNVGQRNVNPVPGGGGEEGLAQGLQDAPFWAGNPDPRTRLMRVDVTLPRFLAERGWKISVRGARAAFELKPREKRELRLEVVPGREFGRHDVETADTRDIVVQLYAGDALVGGITYRLDPDMKEPPYLPGGAPPDRKCIDKAQALLECLDITRRKPSRVRVKKVTVDIEMGDCDPPPC